MSSIKNNSTLNFITVAKNQFPISSMYSQIPMLCSPWKFMRIVYVPKTHSRVLNHIINKKGKNQR